jgi:hypothetical protein
MASKALHSSKIHKNNRKNELSLKNAWALAARDAP